MSEQETGHETAAEKTEWLEIELREEAQKLRKNTARVPDGALYGFELSRRDLLYAAHLMERAAGLLGKPR